MNVVVFTPRAPQFTARLRQTAPRPRLSLAQLLSIPNGELVAVKAASPEGLDFRVHAEIVANGKKLWAVGPILEVPFEDLKRLVPWLIPRAGWFYGQQELDGPNGLLNRGWEYTIVSRERVCGDNWTVTVQFFTPSGFRIEARGLDARKLPEGMELPGWLKVALRNLPARLGKTERDRKSGAAARAAANRASRAAETAAAKGSGGSGKSGGKGK